MVKKISVVVPVFCCEACIQKLYERLLKTFKEIGTDFEIIMVNDNSPDNSWSVIEKLSYQDSRLKGVNLSRNFGQHTAIAAGLSYVSGDWIVVMDCDLQDKPEEIKKLYAKALEGYDIVLGRRRERQDSLLKKAGSKLFYKALSYLTDVKQDGEIANFGIYNAKVASALKTIKEKKFFFPTHVKWVGFTSTSIPIEHAAREAGRSSYSLGRLVKLAFDAIISFSDKPLRLTAKLGLSISATAFFYALYIVSQFFLGIKKLQGWSSLIVSIWFLSGLIIFILGIIGLYISRIYDEVKQRPSFIVESIIGFDK